MCRLQIVSITVGNVLWRFIVVTVFLPALVFFLLNFGTPYFIGLFVFCFFLGFDSPRQIDVSSSLALYLWHVEKIQSPSVICFPFSSTKHQQPVFVSPADSL